jgi:hypothetical protein
MRPARAQWRTETFSVKEIGTMKLHQISTVGTLGITFALFSSLGFGSVNAATASSAVEARYQQERQACLDGSSNQDRATCLKEASAARTAQLNTADARKLQENAAQRCQVHHSSKERLACERLAQGEGTRTGSVQKGAVLKELTTRSAAPLPAASTPR